MDTQIADLHALVARVDERTIAIHDTLEDIRNAQKNHEDKDDIIHAEMVSRVGKVETNQRWIARLITTVGAMAVTVVGWFVVGG